MQFDPVRLEQPLSIPFQLTREPPLRDSPNVIDLGGTGDYCSPKRLKFRMQPGPDMYVVAQVKDYVSLGRHMEPPLFYEWLLKSELGCVELGIRQFHITDALPLFLASDPVVVRFPLPERLTGSSQHPVGSVRCVAFQRLQWPARRDRGSRTCYVVSHDRKRATKK